jgi:hypothetical protein
MLLCKAHVMRQHVTATNILVTFGFMLITSKPLDLRVWNLVSRQVRLCTNTV